AGAQVEAADLRGRDVGVVRAGQVAGLGRAQEAEAVGQDLQHAVGLHALAGAGEHLEQGEDDVLLARAGDAVGNAELLGDVEQLVRRHALEVAERILREAFGNAGWRQALALVVAVVVARQAVVAVAVAVSVAVAAVAEALAAVGGLGAAAVLLLARPSAVMRLRLVAAGFGGRGCRRRCLGGRSRRWRGRRWRRRGGRIRRGGGLGGLGRARLAHALLGGIAGIGGVVGQVRIPR